MLTEAGIVKAELLVELCRENEEIIKIMVIARKHSEKNPNKLLNYSIIQLLNMYIILVYDCGEKRVGKMLKLCRKYLNWIQNSVFEGEISEVKLKELVFKAENIMELDEDSLIIFSGRTEKWMEKQIIGKERSSIENFL